MMRLNNTKPTPIIFDTDMDLDCDDAGALAVLHALMDFNEASNGTSTITPKILASLKS